MINIYATSVFTILVICTIIILVMAIYNTIEINKKYRLQQEKLDKLKNKLQEELKLCKSPYEKYTVVNKYLTNEDREDLRKDLYMTFYNF